MQFSLLLPWYSVYGGLLIALAIMIVIWLVYIVEKARQPPWAKIILAIILIALATGFGLHLILFQFAI
ncbi:MAG: hypothetical protein ACFFD8_01305 [Candidatus Thorarchaeota archaeon]